MSVHTGRSQIYSAMKALRAQWEQVEEKWDDAVADEFAERYWLPLNVAADSAVAAMDRIGPLLQRIRRDCAEEHDPL